MNMKATTSVLLVLFTLTVANAADKPTKWRVKGDLEEACSCNAPCPCWFQALPSRMTCDGAQIIFIDKGKYGKTSLDGLAVAQFVQSPENKSMAESFGNWNIDYIYIDEKANEVQRAALKEIATHLFAPGGKKHKFQVVPISRTIKGGEHISTVGNYAVCSGHLIQGGYEGAPKISNVPLADPTHKEFKQGQTTKLTYTDAGQNWKYEDSNYMFNHFDVDSKEYEKFEADMAKKMEKMKGKM
jgi:hypothetical protein